MSFEPNVFKSVRAALAAIEADRVALVPLDTEPVVLACFDPLVACFDFSSGLI
jgi:hypothetical protein